MQRNIHANYTYYDDEDNEQAACSIIIFMLSSMADGEEIEAGTLCCASCGIAENDDVKLRECDDCGLVKYCSDECQNNHKSEHEEECNKRAAELRDELLFKQPESSHHGDCPICCLPLPLDMAKTSMCYSCSKVICKGCNRANQKRGLVQKCPFCREPLPKTVEEGEKLNMKRIEANDPVALCYEGVTQHKKGDHRTAFEYYTKAADLRSADAHYRLAEMYDEGEGVEMEPGKVIHHLEEAAIGGHPHARYNLGVLEWNNGNYERAVKHWIIAATQGEDDSIKDLIDAFKEGFMAKEDLAAALRAHKAAVDATKSPQREGAEEFYRAN